MSYYYTKPSIFSSLLDNPKYSSYQDASWAYERITSPGYKYDPLSRYIYSSTPRKIYPWDYYDYSLSWPYHNYFNGQLEWEAHQKRMDELDSYFPTKFINPRTYRPRLEFSRGASLPPIVNRTYSPLSSYRARSVTPGPVSASERAFRLHYPSLTTHSKDSYTRRSLVDLLTPSIYLPRSRISRDPWWWEYPGLRPYRSPYMWNTRYPYYSRTTYLSPVKRSYIWTSSLYPYSTYHTYYWI